MLNTRGGIDVGVSVGVGRGVVCGEGVDREGGPGAGDVHAVSAKISINSDTCRIAGFCVWLCIWDIIFESFCMGIKSLRRLSTKSPDGYQVTRRCGVKLNWAAINQGKVCSPIALSDGLSIVLKKSRYELRAFFSSTCARCEDVDAATRSKRARPLAAGLCIEAQFFSDRRIYPSDGLFISDRL